VKANGRSQIALEPAPGTSMPVVSLADGSSKVSGVRVAVRLDRLQIGGRVTHEGGRPAVDVRVVAIAPAEDDAMTGWEPPSAEATTGPDGRFVLRDLVAGAYVVRASAGGGVVAAVEGVAAGATGVAVTLPALGAIDGELVGFGDSVEVAAVSPSSMDLSTYRGRIAGSRFSIRALPPGEYTVTAREGDRADSVEVAVAGSKTSSVRLATEGTATVAGRVVDLVTQAPLVDLECSAGFGGTGRDRREVTDAAGRFRLVVPARRKVSIICHGRSTLAARWGSADVELAPGATGDVLLEIVVPRRAVAGDMPHAGIALGEERPATVANVVPGSPAERAGVLPGDVLVSVDGVAVARFDPGQVTRLILDHAVGDRVALVLERAGRHLSLVVQIVRWQPEP
jgi:hypothetical protein